MTLRGENAMLNNPSGAKKNWPCVSGKFDHHLLEVITKISILLLYLKNKNTRLLKTHEQP